jgi:hypothetical protein
MKNAIQPGDRVILSPVNGLGCSPFEVLEVVDRQIHGLHVRGANGQTWWARSEGAKVLVQAGDILSNPNW